MEVLTPPPALLPENDTKPGSNPDPTRVNEGLSDVDLVSSMSRHLALAGTVVGACPVVAWAATAGPRASEETTSGAIIARRLVRVMFYLP
ncbi:hypothetical protein ACWDAZ_06100 [Streptomyces sp. NPDC001215]